MSTYTCSVTPDCLDGGGLARIPAIYEMIINSIGLHIKDEGFGINVMEGRGLSWTLARGAFEFGRRPSLYEKLTVSVCDGEKSALTTSRYVKIFDENGDTVARAVADWCVIDKQTRKPTPFEVPSDNDLLHKPCPSPQRIRPFVSSRRSSRKVGYSECDFNGHLNNCRYVEMFYNLLPKRIANRTEGVRLDINFLKEIPLGAQVVSYLKPGSYNDFQFCMQHNGSPACCAALAPIGECSCTGSLEGLFEH